MSADGFGEEVAVDDWAEAEAAAAWLWSWRRRGCVGGERAQVGEVAEPKTAWRRRRRLLELRERWDRRAAAQGKAAPLSPMALARRPLESGEAICALTEKDPADSPKTVTLAGSPPKAAMLLLHPVERGDLVEQAVVAGGVAGGFGGEFGVGEEAEDAEAVVHGDDDDAAVGEELAVLAGLGACRRW